MNENGFLEREVHWSAAEKKIARKAFDQAYERQCAAIRTKMTNMVATASTPAGLWKIHDYLSMQRRAMDQTYDYRYSVLFNVFARLLKEKWLNVLTWQAWKQAKSRKFKSRWISGVAAAVEQSWKKATRRGIFSC